MNEDSNLDRLALESELFINDYTKPLTNRDRVSPRASRKCHDWNQAFLFWAEKLKPREVNLLSKTKIPQCTSRKKSTILCHQLFLNIPLGRKWAETLLKASLLVPAVTLTKALFWERFPSFPAQLTLHSQDLTYCRVSVRGSESWWFSRKGKGRERCQLPPSPPIEMVAGTWEIKVT